MLFASIFLIQEKPERKSKFNHNQTTPCNDKNLFRKKIQKSEFLDLNN